MASAARGAGRAGGRLGPGRAGLLPGDRAGRRGRRGAGRGQGAVPEVGRIDPHHSKRHGFAGSIASRPCACPRPAPIQSMIYVDGDACPVRDEVFRVATRLGLEVMVVSNGSRPVRPPGLPNVEMVLVTEGADAADDWIAERRAAAISASPPTSRWPPGAWPRAGGRWASRAGLDAGQYRRRAGRPGGLGRDAGARHADRRAGAADPGGPLRASWSALDAELAGGGATPRRRRRGAGSASSSRPRYRRGVPASGAGTGASGTRSFEMALRSRSCCESRPGSAATAPVLSSRCGVPRRSSRRRPAAPGGRPWRRPGRPEYQREHQWAHRRAPRRAGPYRPPPRRPARAQVRRVPG